MSALPAIGSTLRITLPGDITRTGKILGYDDDMVLVRWVEYMIPDEWILARHLT